MVLKPVPSRLGTTADACTGPKPKPGPKPGPPGPWRKPRLSALICFFTAAFFCAFADFEVEGAAALPAIPAIAPTMAHTAITIVIRFNCGPFIAGNPSRTP